MKSVKCNFGTLAVLSLALTVAASSFGQTANSKQEESRNNQVKQRMSRLIESAKTPADHRRVAEYYREQAQYYSNQSRAYGEKIAAYNRTPYLNSCTMCVTTSYSLEAAVHSLRISKRMAEERADEMLKLAVMHERMAGADLPDSTTLGL